ncbi:HK97 family phage prohead protease [candidate division KSB1 bacterium]
MGETNYRGEAIAELLSTIAGPDYRRRFKTDIRIKDINRDSGTLVAYASTKSVDSLGEVILPDAFDLTRYLKNPVVPFGHDYRQPPIAKAEWVKPDGFGLLFKPKFAKTKFARDIFELYAGGFMNGFSVGYNELTRAVPEDGEFPGLMERWEIHGDPKLIATRVLLFEISAVVVPANEDALVQAKSKGLVKSPELTGMIEKRKYPVQINRKETTPFHDCEIEGNLDAPWEAAAEVRQADVDALKRMCAWYDASKPGSNESYKLPHHRAADGNRVVWRGVTAALGALVSARGGLNIPENARQAVYEHLAEHYHQFGVEPPVFRDGALEDPTDATPLGGIDVSRDLIVRVVVNALQEFRLPDPEKLVREVMDRFRGRLRD